jgi:hypothetical protein
VGVHDAVAFEFGRIVGGTEEHRRRDVDHDLRPQEVREALR